MSNIKEVTPKDKEIPEGYVGNLNKEQHAALVEMWKQYFEICDRARGRSSADGAAWCRRWSVADF
jgi:hypothetical protein